MNTFTTPITRRQVVDAYFLEHRAKVIDIAAFLDRVERARLGDDDAGDDFRVSALRRALAILSDGQPHRAQRVLELLSDHSTELSQSAAGMKGAAGAPRERVDDAEQAR